MQMLAVWDQLVMMPGEGAPARAQQLGTLARLTHERATGAEVGSWLAELDGGELDALDADVVRIARRDWERARRVPTELAVERAEAGAQGQESWRVARENDDFAAFAPALQRNVELARAYAECLLEPGERRYDALLGDYDFGLQTSDLQRLFGALATELPPLADAAAQPLATDGARDSGRRPGSRRGWSRSSGSASSRRAGVSTSRRIRSRPGSGRATVA